jgi:Fe2+ transport system protein FeoA
MPPTVSERLADANEDEDVVIRRVNSHDVSMLRMLQSHGLMLNTTLRIAARDADSGALIVQHGKRRITLDREVTENIFVERR